jgi:hypothetical protein
MTLVSLSPGLATLISSLDGDSVDSRDVIKQTPTNTDDPIL